jgi:hypothetical protein
VGRQGGNSWFRVGGSQRNINGTEGNSAGGSSFLVLDGTVLPMVKPRKVSGGLSLLQTAAY